jgi:enoyl-CoA hydratase
MIEVSGPDRGIATVTLARPQRCNALDLAGFRGLAAAWREFDADQDVRVIVVTGAAGDFCSGADLSVLSDDMRAATTAGTSMRDLWLDINQAVLRDARLGTPVVAAVEGICFGAGLELVGATDIRVAAQTARFALPEVTHGVIASGGTLARLAGQIPYAAAMQLVLTGAEQSAERMLQVGFVTDVVVDGAALATATRIAGQIADNGPAAVQASKRVVQRSLELDRAAALAFEAATAREILAGAEAAEGTRAFREKRSPLWRLG